MKDKILMLVAEVLHVEPAMVTENSKADDFDEWDSLAHVMLIGELEEKLGISIPLDEAVEITTVKEILEKAGL